MRGLRVRVPLYVAGLAGGAAFSALFGGSGLYTLGGAAVVASLVGSAGAYRFALVFPATALYALLAVYGRLPPFALSGWRDLIAEIGMDLYAAFGTMYAQPLPYDAGPGLLVICISIIMVVVAFATSATLYEERPVVSIAALGLTICVLSTISFEDAAGPFFAVFLVAAVPLLLFSGTAEGGASLVRPGLLAGAAVAVLVLAVPKLPFSEATVGEGMVDWTTIGASWGSPRLAVQADVGNYLNSGRETELFQVRSEEPLFWRGGTLDRFDGVRWTSTAIPGAGGGEKIATGVETRRVEQSVRISGATTDVIFGGYSISSVSGLDATRRSDGSWIPDEPLSNGSTYSVVSEVPQPTTEQLQSAGTSYPAEVGEKYLQIPEGLTEEVPETARTVRERYSPETPYDTARAVERYLLYDGGFTYNLDVDYGRADRAIEEFLGDGREGFCVQFATSMTLVLREMGVPARVVYGATSGEKAEPGEYVVRGKNMHTWVEVYFPDVGWYPFNPTPGISTPAAMEENAPREEVGAGGAVDQPVAENRLPAATAQDAAESSATQTSRDATPSASEQSDPPTRPAVALALLVSGFLGGIPALKRLLAARGTPAALYRDVLGRLDDTLCVSSRSRAVNPASLTPTERLVGAAAAAGLDAEPFEELAGAYSEYLYSPCSSADMRGPHRRALRAIERLPRWRRALGAFNPVSLRGSLVLPRSSRRVLPSRGDADG